MCNYAMASFEILASCDTNATPYLPIFGCWHGCQKFIVNLAMDFSYTRVQGFQCKSKSTDFPTHGLKIATTIIKLAMASPCTRLQGILAKSRIKWAAQCVPALWTLYKLQAWSVHTILLKPPSTRKLRTRSAYLFFNQRNYELDPFKGFAQASLPLAQFFENSTREICKLDEFKRGAFKHCSKKQCGQHAQNPASCYA